MRMLAAIHDGNDTIDVSVVGLIVGLLLAIVIYWVGVVAARETGTPVLRIVGAIVGLVVFLWLGFDLHD